jgi:hypothetical protein
MTIFRWRVLLWVGLVTLGAGVLVGLLPLASQGESCGSAFHAGNPFLTAAPTCDDLRSLVRVPGIVLVVLGAGLSAVSALGWIDLRDNPRTQAKSD